MAGMLPANGAAGAVVTKRWNEERGALRVVVQRRGFERRGSLFPRSPSMKCRPRGPYFDASIIIRMKFTRTDSPARPATATIIGVQA